MNWLRKLFSKTPIHIHDWHVTKQEQRYDIRARATGVRSWSNRGVLWDLAEVDNRICASCGKVEKNIDDLYNYYKDKKEIAEKIGELAM